MRENSQDMYYKSQNIKSKYNLTTITLMFLLLKFKKMSSKCALAYPNVLHLHLLAMLLHHGVKKNSKLVRFRHNPITKWKGGVELSLGFREN